jgi:hypothetical protein
MLAISPSQRVLLAIHAVDFRKGMDGLIGLCRQKLAGVYWECARGQILCPDKSFVFAAINRPSVIRSAYYPI